MFLIFKVKRESNVVATDRSLGEVGSRAVGSKMEAALFQKVIFIRTQNPAVNADFDTAFFFLLTLMIF